MSKEDCLYKYERFVDEVQANCAGYSEKDWLKADKRFNRFNDTLTRRFGNKLSPEEKIRAAKARIIYDSYRYGGELFDEINKISRAIEEGVRNYTDNHLADDIDFLLEQGVKIDDILEGFQGGNDGKMRELRRIFE
jgi:hypothetical protein